MLFCLTMRKEVFIIALKILGEFVVLKLSNLVG